MPINYKDINELTEQTTIAGTEKVPVSGTKYVFFNKIKDWIINSLKTTGLDLGGKQIKNVAIDVVTSLPATGNFTGRQVTYQGRIYIWNGSAWKCDSDYMEIGGRNLLLKSKVPKADTSYNIGNWTSSRDFIVGETLTITIKGSIPGTKSFGLWFNGGSIGTGSIPKIKDGYYSKQLVVPANVTSRTVGLYLIGNQTAGDSWEFEWIKLESGNKATYDWTPAPEDKANENQTINFNTITEPTETGTKTKTSTTLWQNLFAHINFLWLKLKDLFPTTQATTHNYLPKINNADKKLVKSNIQDDGNRVQIDSPLRVNSHTFYNVSQYQSPNASVTGTIKILLPFGWDFNNWINMDIDLYQYQNNKGGSKLIVSGRPTTGWYGTSATIIGQPISRQVRFGYDSVNSKCVILLGNTTTTWARLQINLSKIISAYFDYSTQIPEISLITDETGITNIVTPQVNAGFDVDLLDGKHASDFATSTHNHDTTYLGITEKASDSDKLNGKHAEEFAQLDENDKIKTSNLPDYLLGQVLYGGSINASRLCTFSSLYKDKFNTTANTGALSGLPALSHVGVYFIASGSFMLNGTIDVEVGDWVISNGNAWGKIDNTDAVASVNGKTGVINLSYEDIGDIPMASEEKIGGVMLGDVVEGLNANFLKGKEPSDFAEANHNHDATYLKRTGGAMSGSLDMGGNNLKNAGFEVVTALPTTNRFVGRRVTYQGENYVWTGSAWNSLALYMQDFPRTYQYLTFDSATCFGWKAGQGLIFSQYQRYGTNAFGVYNSYDCLELFECNYNPSTKADVDTGEVFPNPISNAKIAKRNVWTDSPDVIKYRHKLTEGIIGAIGLFPDNNNLTAWLNATYNGVGGYALKNHSSIFTELEANKIHYLHVAQLNANMKMGLNYTFVGRCAGKGTATLQLTDTKSLENISLTEGQIVLFDFVKVANGVVLYRNLEIR